MATIEKRQTTQGPRYRVRVRRRGLRPVSRTFPTLTLARRWAISTEHAWLTTQDLPRPAAARYTVADLLIRYVYQSDPPKAGGFIMGYVNLTDLAATIPGYPPGTQVIFWIVAWDKDVSTISSPYYSYNLSVDKYTRHENVPFPPVETLVGTSIGLAILVPVSVYFVEARRKRRSLR